VAAVDRAIHGKVAELKRAAASRDRAMNQVRRVRAGETDLIFADFFSKQFPKPMAANFIDVAARDLAEVIAPLPTLNCASGQMKTDADKRRAAKKNKIGQHYWDKSRLDVQMFSGADQYNTYGFLPFYVEPDFDEKIPRICVENPIGCYYEKDRTGRTTTFVKCWREKGHKIAAMFPEFASTILKDPNNFGADCSNQDMELIKYCDDNMTTLYLPCRNDLALASYQNFTDHCPYAVAERAGLDPDNPRGQFDDVVWVQMARNMMVTLSLETAHKAVRAPLVVPRDVNELPTGPDAVIRTDNGNGVRRVPLEVPVSALQMDQMLDTEAKVGARYPDARLGQTQASVITGRGVESLMGSFDTQIKTAQVLLGEELKRTTQTCFAMDEKLWPNLAKTINGTVAGETFELTYIPKRDIAGNYVCDVTYGFLAGLAPNQAAVLLLQLRGDEVIGRDTFRRQMPWPIDVDDEQRQIDVQKMEDAIMQAFAAYAQIIGPLAAQGGDPSQPLQALAQMIKGRRSGEPVEDLVLRIFPAPTPSPDEGQAAPTGTGGTAQSGGGDLAGIQDSGLPFGVAQGQAEMGPGGRPDIQSFLAGLRSGKPVMDASVRRQIPA
jgi:hypothetical protein